MRKTLLILAVLVLILPQTAIGENLFVRRTVPDPDWDHIVYWVYAPDTVNEQTPVILFMHGSGEKGDIWMCEAVVGNIFWRCHIRHWTP